MLEAKASCLPWHSQGFIWITSNEEESLLYSSALLCFYIFFVY